MTAFGVSGLVIVLTSLFLGVIVFVHEPRRRLNQLWAMFTVSVALWGLSGFLIGFTRDTDLALLLWKVANTGIFLIPVLFYHVVCLVCSLTRRKTLIILYGYGLTVVLLNWFGDFVGGVREAFSSFYYLYPGRFYPLAFGLWWAIVCWTHYEVWKKYQAAIGLERNRLKYFFAGSMAGFIGSIMNFLPVFHIDVYPWGNFMIPLYTVLYGYGIFAYQLMDVEVIIRRTAVFTGMTLAMLAMIAGPTLIAQTWLAGWGGVHPALLNLLGVALIMLTYERMKKWLVDVTDHFLFQKKYDYREVLKTFTDEIVVGIKDLGQLGQMSVARLAEAVKLRNCHLLLLNRDTRQYELVASAGVNGRRLVLAENEPFITFLRETREPIGRDGQLGKIRFPEAVTERLNQLEAQLCLPLQIHDELIGVLCLGKKKSDEEFTKDDVDTLSTAANALAISLANAQQADELAKTQAEAAQREKLAVIGTLSAGINHEICNPLGIVKAQCESFLLDLQDGILVGKSPQEVTERASTIMNVALKQIDRATAITQKLSSFAKPIKQPTMQPVPVEQEVDEVLILVGHDLELSKIEVKKEIEPELPKIFADRRQLQEVLFNLVRNAGQAIIPPGTITVRASARDGQVRIEIADTGTGIPPDKLGKIYDPFFTTKEPGRGTGLGLFIVRQIVERNKGRISVESAVGKGTTFFLDFPAAETPTGTVVPRAVGSVDAARSM